ncbi:MAG: HmuY family protein [Bradymonadaceae bacterium]
MVGLAAALSVACAACGGAGDESHSPERSVSADTDLVTDAGTETTEVAPSNECDPRAVARRKVGAIETTADGSVDVEKSSGVYAGSVEATAGGEGNADDSSYLYVDLATGERLELSDAEAFENERWDLAFKRTDIRVNSADSGPGAWYLIEVDRDWEQLDEPPRRDADWEWNDFVADDCSVKTVGDGALKTAFGQWSDEEPAVWALYQFTSHTTLKFEIQSYTDGTYQVRWTEL